MKACKPNYRMNKFTGCGEVKPILRYGSCQQCFIKWVNDTPEGKAWFEKNRVKKFKENQKEKRVEQKKIDRKMRIEMMSTSEYWSKVFQPKFNELIRIIDKGSGCIATRRTTGQMQSGHYIHAGSNKTISINAHNIFLQSMESNHFQSGDILKYQDGLINTFGEDYFEFVQSLKKCPSLHLTKIELMEAYEKVLKLRLDLKKQELQFLSPLERIEMRNLVNETLCLYPKEFSSYCL